LRGFARRVARLADAQELLHQVVLARQGLDGAVQVGQPVVGLLEPRNDAEAGHEVLVELGAGFAGGDLAAELALARERQLLRHHDAGVRVRLLAQALEGQRVAARVVAQRQGGIGQAAGLGRALAQRFIAFLSRQDFGIARQRFPNQIFKPQPDLLAGSKRHDGKK